MDAPAMEDSAGGRGGDLLMATRREIAEWLGVPEDGVEGRSEIARVSSIEGASADAAVFAMDAAALGKAIFSSAGLILAPSGLERADSRVLRVKDAKYAFALVGRKLQATEQRGFVHSSAILGRDVALGMGTRVGPGCVIGDGVRTGEDCEILGRVTIYPGTVLGSRVVVQAGAVLGSTGFGYVRNGETGEYLMFPQQGGLYVEDDVEVGANTTIDRGALGETRIGRGTKIDNLVHIGHNCLIGKNVIIAAQTGISGSSVVEDGAILGGQVGIGEHATVGAGVILGGGAGVLSGKKMRGPGEVFWGRPARPLKEYLRDLARLKRR